MHKLKPTHPNKYKVGALRRLSGYSEKKERLGRDKVPNKTSHH